MNAACHRCGGAKAGPFLPCPECGHTPSAPDRALSWLFSSFHLNIDELRLAAQRVRAGEIPDPGSALLTHASQQINHRGHMDLRPLSPKILIGIGVGSLLLTPLMGFAVWWGLRNDRPVAAGQVIRITTPIAAAMGALWVGIVALRLFS